MSEPDREPAEKPTQDEQTAEREGKQLIRSGIGIAVVSIVILLALVLALMQASGLVDLLEPFAETETQQWGVFFVIALAVIALAAWSWNSIASR
ncbi:hypothetical protein HALLA_15910 [Halostagnicola larsenii XH-48]|uniref:Uncharacterized protein n=1 Tax=Halostagnicola larsenii XH-48 TaxID=797299 RepID=W0JN92_9EURY|nr:hypothetical protein [Halostagnicola larsenii]AHG00064.1 hypothetical protein HALLA_15910 [Halostagnicola larsenii XH-48]